MRTAPRCLRAPRYSARHSAAFHWFRRRLAVLLAALIGFWQIAPSLHATTLSWDTVSGNGGAITGGSGTWTSGLGGWNTGSGDTTWNNSTPDAATFGGTAGTVTLGGAVTVGNMVFNSGYTLAGGVNTLTLLNSTITANTSATISATLGGTTGLIKEGTATLTLSGTNTYTGVTTINGGILTVTALANGGSNSNIGAANSAAANLVLNGGTLQYNNNTTANTDHLFSVGTAGGTISLPVAGTLNFTNTGNLGFNGQTGTRTLTFAFSNSTPGGIIALASGISDNDGATSVVKTNTYGTLRLTNNNNTYTGTTTLNGGSVSIGTVGGSTGSIGTGDIILNNSSTLFVSRSGSVNLAQTISGTGGVTSNGNTALTLSGTNTYTGVTRIISNGGVVTVSDIGNGGVASSIGASSSAAGNLSITNLGVLKYVGVGTTTDRLFEVPTGTANPVATIEASGTGALVFANTGAMGLGSLTGARTLVLSGTNTDDNTMTPVIGDYSGATALTKSGTGTWILAGNNTYTGVTTISAGVLEVGNGGTTGSLGSGTIANSGTLIINRSDAITISAGMSGTGAFIQNGTGTTTLNGNNQWGSATVNAGILAAGATNSLGTFSPMTVNAGGTLVIKGLGSSAEVGSLAGSGIVQNGGATASIIAVGSVISGTTTFSGTIIDGGTGSMGVDKGGASYTLILSGLNTYTGPTRVFAGTLSVSNLADGGNASSIGASTNAASNLVLETSSSVLKYTGPAVSTDRLFTLAAGSLDASGTGAIHFTNTGSMGLSNSGTHTLTLTGTNTDSNTLAAEIGDNGGATSVRKSGIGTWALSGASSYTGVTSVFGGILSVSSLANGGQDSSIGASTNAAANLIFNTTLQYTGAATSTDRLFSIGIGSGPTLDSSGTGALNFTNTGSLGFYGSGLRTLNLAGTNTDSNTLAATITDNGSATSLTKSGVGNWVLTGTNTYTGTTAIIAGTLQVGDGDTTGTLGTGAVIDSAALVINRSDDLTLANSISGAGTFTQAGTGTTTFTGSRSYSGATFINAGKLQAGGSYSFSASSAVTVASGAVLEINGFTSAIGGLSGTGTVQNGSATGATLNVGGTASSTFDGLIQNGGSAFLAFNKGGSGGTLTLTGSNTYTGGTIVSSGVLSVSSLANGGSASNIGASSKAASSLILTGGTLRYTGAAVSTDRLFTVTPVGGTLDASGTGAVNFTNTGSMGFNSQTGARTLTLTGTNTDSNTIAAVIGDNGGATTLVKTGDGTWTLAGASTFTGTTTINAGTLEVTSNNALGTADAGTAVSSGATLALNNVNYSTAEALTLNGSGVGAGGALLNSGTSTYAGSITAATDASINAGGGSLNLTGGLVKDGTVLTITGGGTVTVSGTGISGASAHSDLVVDGVTLIVSADSDYNGPTTVQNSAILIANASVITTQLALSSDSTLAGTGALTTAMDQSIFLNGMLTVGDPTVAATASTLALTTSGTGAVVLGAGSQVQLDLLTGAGLGDNTGNASAADSINLHGKLDATAGGTLVIGNPNAMAGFHGGDQWQLFKLNTGGANAGSLVSNLALNASSLLLASGVTSFLDQNTGVFTIIDTNSGLATAATESQALISASNTVTADINGHLFNLRAGGGEEADADSNSISAALDEGVIVGQGDGDPQPQSPIAKRVPRSRQWEIFATVNYGNVKLSPIRSQSGVQVDSWASGVGIERHLSRGLILGFATSFLQSTQGYTGNAGSLYLEGPALSTYLSYVRGNLWNSLLYSFGTYQMDSTRNPGAPFPTAFGSTRTYTHSIQYNTGWNFRFQNNTLVTGPFVGVDYLHGTVDAYSETGGGIAALHYGAQSFQSLISRVGWSASKKLQTSFATITPQVRLSYERQNVRNNNGTSVSLLNVPFSATAGNQSPGQDYLVAGLGVNVAFTDRFSLMLSYQGQFFRHDLQAHFGSVRLSYKF